MTLQERVGATIQELRQLRGWTQHDFAKKTGIPYGSIKNYEQGAHAPSLSRLQRMAEAFDADASSLLKDAGI